MAKKKSKPTALKLAATPKKPHAEGLQAWERGEAVKCAKDETKK